MTMIASNLDKLNLACELANQRLLSEMNEEGLWQGRLASSAVSTAVACFALAKLAAQEQSKINLARNWLIDNINADGGWGDTPQSPSNLSATLLSRAALLLETNPNTHTREALLQSQKWLEHRIKGSSPTCIIEGVLDVYGKDLTFSVPILTLCALGGMFSQKDRVWSHIPQLPFECAVLPHTFFHFLKLPVVSYAIPALIAVGIAQFKHAAPKNFFIRYIRQQSIKPALKKLEKLTPQHGGFLEAAPLTAFVATCLGCSGFENHPTVIKALDFLSTTIRQDGSWPIDTDLSLWLTTLAVKALDGQESFSNEFREKIIHRLKLQQFKDIHPFTHARPGGWGWTNLPGAVPDADDTAGALTALALLSPGKVTREVTAGLEWLLDLRNRDGGIPTFCRGWGFLPFDRSCPDISAHTLNAFFLWLPYVSQNLQRKIKNAIKQLIPYLEKSRDADLVWTPLWFGDQNALQQTNRVYGTATVLISLSALPYEQVKDLIEPAIQWLKNSRNADGGWGGEADTPSLMETTSLVITALSLCNTSLKELEVSVHYLTEQFILHDGRPPCAPIGFYFASLWYDEKLYPLLFGVRALNNIKKRYVSIEHV